MNEILAALMQNAIFVAALVPLVWCLARWRRCRPAEQHLLWLVLMIKLVLPPIWVFEWSTLAGPRATPPLRVESVGTVDDSADLAELSWLDVSSDAPLGGEMRTHDQDLFAGATPAADALVDLLISYGGWIWIAGAIVCAVIMVRRIARELNLLRLSDPAPAELIGYVNSAAGRMRLGSVMVRVLGPLASPVVLWWRRPLLLWPASLVHQHDRESLASVLTHELAHVQRRDHFVVWLETFIAIVEWWNPVFWLVRRRLRETREMACDAIALASGEQSRRAYVETLMGMATGQTLLAAHQPVVGMGAISKTSLKRRITMIFEKNVTGRLSAAGLVVAGCLGLVCLSGFAGTQAQPPTQVENQVPSALPPTPAATNNDAPVVPPDGIAAGLSPQPVTDPPATSAEAPKSVPFLSEVPYLGRLFTTERAPDSVHIELSGGGTVSDSNFHEQIKKAIDELIEEAVKDKDAKSADELRRVREKVSQRYERINCSSCHGDGALNVFRDAKKTEGSKEELDRVHAKFLQRYKAKALVSKGYTPLTAANPNAAPAAGHVTLGLKAEAPATTDSDGLKYEIQLAEIDVEEKVVLRDELQDELKAISAAAAKGITPRSDERHAEYKVKLADLALRKARVQLERLKVKHHRTGQNRN